MAAPDADRNVIALATRAAECAVRQGKLDGFHRLAVIDYSKPSTEPRLWVFDVERGRLLFHELAPQWGVERAKSDTARADN